MKKKVVLLMLSIAAVLCMIGFVACSNDSEDPPVTITDPTLQEQYDAFCEFIENDTDKYTVSLSMEQAGEKVTEMLSVASDRVYGKMTSEEYSQESYVWLNEDYAYTRTTYNNKTEHSLEYMPGHSFGIRTMLNELSKELLYTEDFLASLQDNIAVANDAIIFSFEDTQNGISCQNGTLTFAEDSVKINFDLLLLNLPVYDPSGSIVAVQIEINALGTNTVEFPFELETEFAGITTLDRLYAQMVWVLDAESATLDVQMSGSSLMGEGTEIPFTLQLSGGEALAEIDIGGSATIAMGAIYKDNTFFYITETTSGAQSSMDVSSEEYGYTVARFFELLSFNLRTKEYFTLVSGSETQLTLSEQGKQWYVYCDELLIDFSKPSEYVISAKLNNPSMPENLICTIKDVGIEKEIEFPDSWKEYVAFYVDGIRYTDVSVSDAYEAEATSLEQYNSDLVIPENITVNGQAYSVVSLNSNFLNRYGYSLNTIVIPSTVVNMNEALVGAYNLDFLYYGGTQVAFEEVAGSTLPQGTIVYYYSEEQPQGEGNYWHWNEAHTAAERWPGGEEPAVQYQVYFDTNGNGYLDSSTVYASVIEEAPIPNSYDNMKSFAGWYTDPNCSDGNKVAFPYTVTGDITLYAKWEEIPFIFELNEEGTGYIVTDYIGDRFGESQTIIIPETHNGLPVVEIGEQAFINCENIERLSIPSSIRVISPSAFDGCQNLRYNEYDNAYYLGNDKNPYVVLMQAKDQAIDSCIIHEKTKIINHGAFVLCENLTDITIPNGVVFIGINAFFGCDRLTDISVPDSIQLVAEGAFECANLSYNLYNGAYYLGNNINPYVFLIQAADEVTDCVIHENTKVINNFVFQNCDSLKSVSIPGGIVSIGPDLFYNCVNLTSVEIENGIKEIGQGMFSGCEKLETVVIPDSVLSIGYGAFIGCSNLKSISIGDSVSFIGNDAFAGCRSLTEIVIPNSVTSIGWNIFAGCESLQTVVIGRGVTFIGGSAFRDCSNLEEITVIDGNTAYYTAGNCLIDIENQSIVLGLNDCVIPSDGSVLSIADYAFSARDKLTNIEIPESIRSIGSYAFSNCTNLTTVSFAENSQLRGIADYAFENCGKLTSIMFPEGIDYIGRYAFFNCESLTDIFIPASVEDIGDDVFRGCTSIESIRVANGNATYHSKGNCLIETESKTLILGCKNSKIPSDGSVTIIGDYAFDSCTGLTSIVFPDSITSIGNDAFDGCTGLTSIVIPDSVTSIGMNAFNGCNALTIYCEATSKPDGWDVYWNRYSSHSPFYGLRNSCYPVVWNCKSDEIADDGYIYTVIGGIRYALKDGTATVSGQPSNISASIIIPASVTYKEQSYSVTSIGNHAFDGCIELTSITIPDSVTSIGDCAFYGCIGLTSITIPDSVTSIGYEAFFGCSALTSINVNENNPKYCSENGIVFSKDKTTLVCYPAGKTNSSYFIPDTVTSIGSYAFNGCDTLETVTFGKNSQLESIKHYAFYGCSTLTSISIPDSVIVIGMDAFNDCDALETVTFGKNSQLEVIDYDTFYGCSTLTSITIPESVTIIGEEAFYACDKLETVFYGGTEEQWNAVSIGWRNYDLENATKYYYSEELTDEQKADGNNYWHYGSDGVTPVVWTKETT